MNEPMFSRSTEDATMIDDALQRAAERMGASQAAAVDVRAVRATYARGDTYRTEGITSLTLSGAAGAALALIGCAMLGPVAGAVVGLGALVSYAVKEPAR